MFIAFSIIFSCSSTIVAGVRHSVNVLRASLGIDILAGQWSLICRSRGWMLNPEENRVISLS